MENLKCKLGKQIKSLRKSKYFTQEKLAELISMDVTSLSKIETGRTYPTPETIEKLISALNIEPQELFTFDHQRDNKELIKEINRMISERPEKVPEIYQIIKVVYNSNF